VVDGLGLLCAARDALTLDELGRVAGWTREPQRRAFLRGARELLIETRRAGRVSEYRLHHDSIRAHVAEAIGLDRLAAHHLALAQRLATWPAPVDAAARRYALHHALLHRAEAGAWVDAWRVAADVAFLETKCRELGVHDAEADVTRAAARCHASGDEAQRDRFAELARALGRESHWLRAAPEAIHGAGLEPATPVGVERGRAGRHSSRFRRARSSCACATPRRGTARRCFVTS